MAFALAASDAREIARKVGITERAVQRIIGELEEAGAIERERLGRTHRYSLSSERPGL